MIRYLIGFVFILVSSFAAAQSQFSGVWPGQSANDAKRALEQFQQAATRDGKPAMARLDGNETGPMGMRVLAATSLIPYQGISLITVGIDRGTVAYVRIMGDETNALTAWANRFAAMLGETKSGAISPSDEEEGMERLWVGQLAAMWLDNDGKEIIIANHPTMKRILTEVIHPDLLQKYQTMIVQ